MCVCSDCGCDNLQSQSGGNDKMPGRVVVNSVQSTRSPGRENGRRPKPAYGSPPMSIAHEPHAALEK